MHHFFHLVFVTLLRFVFDMFSFFLRVSCVGNNTIHVNILQHVLEYQKKILNLTHNTTYLSTRNSKTAPKHVFKEVIHEQP